MKNITQHYNRTSYYAKSGDSEMYVTALGGFIMPYFTVRGEKMTPYRVAPWYDEAPFDDAMLSTLRGNFICLPMGGDPDGVNTGGREVPCHGFCACETWALEEAKSGSEITEMDKDAESETSDCEKAVSAGDRCARLVLRYEEKEGTGQIRKELTLDGASKVVYERDTISGYTGKYPVSYHPCINLNPEPGSCHIAISKPEYGSTPREWLESTADGGYELLQHQEIADYTDVMSVYGDHVDLSHQPLQKGIEQAVEFISDTAKPFCFTAVTNPNEGYVYFQLKNPRKLAGTMFWISNGGRHYAPWSGRTHNLIGIEEVTSFFYYGVTASTEPNFMQEHGGKTYLELEADKAFSLEIITGVAELPEDFREVQDIVSADGGIEIIGNDGLRIPVKVDLSFLREP